MTRTVDADAVKKAVQAVAQRGLDAGGVEMEWVLDHPLPTHRSDTSAQVVWVCWKETESWDDGRFVEGAILGVYDAAETAMLERRPKPPRRPNARPRQWELQPDGGWLLQSRPSLHLERRLVRDIAYVRDHELSEPDDQDYRPTP